jgi:prevent-host-death family protein
MAKSSSFDLKDIRSVTDFQRNAKTHLARLKKTKAPMVLTLNGNPSVVVQDAAAYQKLHDRLDEFEKRDRFVAAVREGLEDVKQGRVYPVREVMKYRGR